MSPPSATLIVRTRGAARTVVAALESIRAQTVPAEIVLVDAGSADGTLELAEPLVDRIVHLDGYTPGRALNAGAAVARAPIQGALSAHCVLEDERWLERALAHHEDPRVAATNGTRRGPDGSRLQGPFLLEARDLRCPTWGYSNHAATWRADVWQRHPFDESLPTAEDRKWSWEVVRAGWAIAFDPALDVDMSHRWAPGPLHYFKRVRREQYHLRATAPLPPYRLSDALADWCFHPPRDHHSRLFHLVNPGRLAELLGTWDGRRRTQAP